jgi:hypothetical protein
MPPPGKGWGEDLGEEKDNDLQAVRKAIKDFNRKMRLVLVSVRADQVGVMDHLWSSIVKLGSAIEGLHARVWGIEQDIGDALDLLDEHNLSDLSKGVLQALGQLSHSAISNPGLQDINDKFADLIDLINVVDEDHQKAGRYLLTKLRSTPPTPVLASRAPGVGSLGALNLGMAIVDYEGAQVSTLGQLLKGLEQATNENAHLRVQLESLSADIASQGETVLDGLSFTSKAQVREAVLRECPKGDAFEVFLDVMSLFCCDPIYVLVPGWEKKTRAMEEVYSSMARKVVSSYYEPHCAWYMDGVKVISEKLLAAFKDTDRWNGVSGMDGR